jgi:hypothetical protein
MASVVVAAITLRPDPGRRNSSSTMPLLTLEIGVVEGDATREGAA